MTIWYVFQLVYRQRYLQNRHKDMRHEALTKHNKGILRKKLMIKEYGRSLKICFTYIAVTLTNNFNRYNQNLLKRIVRGSLKAFAKSNSETYYNVTAFRN